MLKGSPAKAGGPFRCFDTSRRLPYSNSRKRVVVAAQSLANREFLFDGIPKAVVLNLSVSLSAISIMVSQDGTLVLFSHVM